MAFVEIPGIYLIAAVTVLFGAAVWGAALYALGARHPRYIWLVLLALPLSTLVSVLVKRPLSLSIAQIGGISPGLRADAPLWYLLVLLLLAPVTEEVVKIAPLLIPQLRALTRERSGALWVGAWLGLGFGLGEAGFLAYGVSLNPRYAAMPWYLFGGYLEERVAICLVHALLTSIVVAGAQRGARCWLLAYVVAAGLHAFVNVGAMLYQLGMISDSLSKVSIYAGLLVLVLVFVSLRARALREPSKPEKAAELLYSRH